MREAGLEPARPKTQVPKTCVSAISPLPQEFLKDLPKERKNLPTLARGVASDHMSDSPDSPLPIKMLHDRVMVSTDGVEGERRSLSGIVIPATASVGKRLAWAVVVATGPNVRSLEVGDRVLYDPEDPNGQGEVEVRGQSYTLLRERDIHAMASPRLGDIAGTGLYL